MIHGEMEEEGEGKRKWIFDTLGKLAPKIHDSLKEGVDIILHIGQKLEDVSCRSTIILFALRQLCDAVSKEARGSKFVLDNKLRIMEALSPNEKAAREKLWP